MKTLLRNCFTTTGLSLLLLAAVATLYQARFIFISSVFQTFLANLVIHIGLLLLQRFESKYFLLEFLVNTGYVLTVLIVSGLLFGWYHSTPTWILILMGIAVYTAGCLIDVFRIKNDVDFINHQLKLRRAGKKDGCAAGERDIP